MSHATPLNSLGSIDRPSPDAPVAAPAIAFAMLSDPGRVRRANEDLCGALPECGAFVVCDGMGGAAAGEVASRLALDAFLDSIGGISRSLFKGSPQDSRARLAEAVRSANQAVYRYSQRSRSLHGMGTTLVALLFEAGARSNLWLVHVGDSRCYRLRAGVLQQLTQDHSLVEEQIQAGVLSRVEAENSPIRNIITRAVGALPTVDPEIAEHITQPGDLYLLASDGLTRELEDAEIQEQLGHAKTDGPGLRAACQSLIDAANAKGGGDNITVLLVSTV